MKFENDIAIQKAMRHFSSYDLAKIIIHNREMADCFRRNMNEVCWNRIENELDGLTEEMPEQMFNRFVERYTEANGVHDEK
jgi:hypothetical protein